MWGDSVPEPTSTIEGVRSVTRAVDLLGLFDSAHPTRALREMTAATGLPKTTIVRLLRTLQAHGLVAEQGETTYALGAGFLRWVRLADALWQVSEQTRAVLRRLVDDCTETANVYVRQDGHRVAIAQQEGTATVRSVVGLGVPLPLGVGAPAKVLLTGATEGDRSTLRAELGDAALAALERQAAAVAETGYAVSHGERELGASAVAAPVRDRDGRVVAALSISGPTSRFTADRIGRYISLVTAAADEISEAGLGPVEVLL